ncbi:hypothetical protein [Glutamicibacter sp.]|uniref:hypothetical protein n=1 Tax=Glutamicibacter sp. TaxID=1931995 RepID=UPI003D6B3345
MGEPAVRIYIVTISASYQVDGVLGELESCGLHIKQVLAALGQVIGEGSEQAAEQLRGLEAVESVDSQQRYRAIDSDS